MANKPSENAENIHIFGNSRYFHQYLRRPSHFTALYLSQPEKRIKLCGVGYTILAYLKKQLLQIL
jgi:hypothetical protein